MNKIVIKNKIIEGVIFDIDGTILDSTGIWSIVDINFFKRRNMEVPIGYQDEIGHIGLHQAAIYTKEKYQIKESIEEIIAEWKNEVVEFYQQQVETKPHVIEFIKILKEKHIPFCAATANDADCYKNGLGRHNILNLFDFVLEVSKYNDKSNPAIYFEASNRLGVDINKCLVIEDLSLAINTAHKAGYLTCGVFDESSINTQEEIKKTSDFYIKDFQELIDLIK